MLPLGSVGAGEACDLLILIFRSRLNCQWKDRSLVALVSSYGRNPEGASSHGTNCNPVIFKAENTYRSFPRSCVGMSPGTLRVPLLEGDAERHGMHSHAERHGMHSHAERGNDQKQISRGRRSSSLRDSAASTTRRGLPRHKGLVAFLKSWTNRKTLGASLLRRRSDDDGSRSSTLFR